MISKEEIDKGFSKLNIIWFAMIGSLLVYLFVGLQVAKDLRIAMAENTLDVIKIAFYLLSFVTLIFTRYVRNLLLSAKGQSRKAFQPFPHPVLQKYGLAEIVAWSLSEAIGIYGLLLYFLGKNATDLYLLILVSAAAMFMHRPKKDEIIRLVQKWETSNSGGATGDL